MPPRKKTTPKTEAKKPAGLTAADKKTLEKHAREINARLERAEKAEGRVNDLRLSAAVELGAAKKFCDEHKVSFKKWCEENVSQSYHTVRKLAQIGVSDDPKQALEDLRGRTAKQQKKSRTAKKSAAADPASVAETALAQLDKKDAAEVVQKAGLGDAVGSGDALADAKFAFDALGAVEKLKLLQYVATDLGAEASIFGLAIDAAVEAADKPTGKKTTRKRK